MDKNKSILIDNDNTILRSTISSKYYYYIIIVILKNKINSEIVLVMNYIKIK